MTSGRDLGAEGGSGAPSADELNELPAGLRGVTDLRGTVGMDAADIARPALPFTPASSATPERALPEPPTPALSLEQTVALEIELAAPGASAAAVLERYRVTAGQRQEIVAYWGHLVQSDSAVRVRWNQAYATYQAWRAQQAQHAQQAQLAASRAPSRRTL